MMAGSVCRQTARPLRAHAVHSSVLTRVRLPINNMWTSQLVEVFIRRRVVVAGDAAAAAC